MDTQRGQKLQGRPERQRASLLQQGESGKTRTKSPSAKAKDGQGRSEAKVLLRKDVWYEGQEHEFQDSQGPEQSYKQEP
tara:strand:+ start:4568 stop:4804 length:237 start_codon:yes stop_codon:yes gene_type:complete